LLVTSFLTLFLKIFSLRGKDASKPAGSWFHLASETYSLKTYSSEKVRGDIGKKVFDMLSVTG